MIREAVILAGGLGTRLQNTVPGLPKAMAPVAGRPFLFYVINYLRMQGITDFIFSLGHKHEIIEEYLKEQFANLSYQVVIENEPLGTGGAIRLACSMAKTDDILVANGDTVFKVNLEKFYQFHQSHNAITSLALKPMHDFERYGTVELDVNQKVIDFKEKKYYREGLINGGLYILNKSLFRENDFPEKFSFEQFYLEKSKQGIYGYTEDAYFIDIGVPADYELAQEQFRTGSLDFSSIDKMWALFIDRDGVINYEKKKDYIRNWDEFRFYPNVPQLFNILDKKFGWIIVVSNQRGIGRQLMTDQDLAEIHRNMQSEIELTDGRIDAIYYCTAISDQHPERKPNPGMALKALKDFPGINFSKSIMVGNTLPDMLFGKNAGMFTVFIATTYPETPFPHPDIDLRFDSLEEFVKAL